MSSLKNLFSDVKAGNINVGKNIKTDEGRNAENRFENLLKTKYKFKDLGDISQFNCFNTLKQLVTGSQSLVLINPAPHEISDGYYVKEPFGSQSFPDFLIFQNGKVVPVEIKCTTNGKPMWNNSLPRQSSIYLFVAYSNTPKKRDLIMFKGSDVITPAMETALRQDAKLLQKLNNKQATYEQLDVHNFGWNLYIRQNFQQTVYQRGLTNVDFTKHPNKVVNANKVITFCQQYNL